MELDRAATIFVRHGIVKRGRDQDSHWVNTMYQFSFETPRNKYLLTLAIQFALITPVKQLLRSQTSLNQISTPLLAFAFISPSTSRGLEYFKVLDRYKPRQWRW